MRSKEPKILGQMSTAIIEAAKKRGAPNHSRAGANKYMLVCLLLEIAPEKREIDGKSLKQRLFDKSIYFSLSLPGPAAKI